MRPWKSRLTNRSYFVTELLGTDLHRLLTSRPLEKQFIQYFLYQILVNSFYNRYKEPGLTVFSVVWNMFIRLASFIATSSRVTSLWMRIATWRFAISVLLVSKTLKWLVMFRHDITEPLKLCLHGKNTMLKLTFGARVVSLPKCWKANLFSLERIMSTNFQSLLNFWVHLPVMLSRPYAAKMYENTVS